MRFALMILLALPFAAQAESDYSLSLFADGATAFTTHGDTQEASGHYKYVPDYYSTSENAMFVRKIQAGLTAGGFQLPASFDLGINVACKNAGFGIGYKQVQPFAISQLQNTYSGAVADVSEAFQGSASYNSFYVAPFFHLRQGQSSFLQFECKLGIASLDGNMKDIFNSENVKQATTPVRKYEAEFHYTSKAFMIEPSIRQGWFINKHASISVEVSYTFLQFSDMEVDPAYNTKVTLATPSIPPHHPFVFKPSPPNFTVDASSFFIKIRLETFLFNAFLNAPAAPKLTLPLQ